MTGQDKQIIYNLLETASASIKGYKTRKSENSLTFSDDINNSQQTIQANSEQIKLNHPISNQSVNVTPAAQASASITQSSSDNTVSPAVTTPVTVTAASSISAQVSKLQLSAQGSSSLQAVADKIACCTRCVLSKTRHNVVPGTGCATPYVLVIGEGPGFEEDMQGLPFVGPAGQLLDKMLGAIELSRSSNTYIANIVKCRPPQNRNPYPEEAEACSSFLQAQIALLKPKMILCAGTVAAKNLLKTELGVTRLRGNFYEYAGIPVGVTYHPSALLRDDKLKRPAWDDLKMFKLKLLELCPDYQKSYVPYVR